ncbi:MAG: hypothetical protein ACOC5T_08060 [Elusimicrobiota bacterium]
MREKLTNKETKKLYKSLPYMKKAVGLEGKSSSTSSIVFTLNVKKKASVEEEVLLCECIYLAEKAFEKFKEKEADLSMIFELAIMRRTDYYETGQMLNVKGRTISRVERKVTDLVEKASDILSNFLLKF